MLVAHPQTFASVSLPGLDELGSLLSREKLANHFTLQLSREPQKLSERLTFLGEIPRRNEFEAQAAIGRKDGAEEDDLVLDDSALVYQSDRGVVIITGCSHAGLQLL